MANLRIPSKWTASEFSRQGALLLRVLAYRARLVQRKAFPGVVRIARESFAWQVAEVIRLSTHGLEKAITLPVSSQAHLWVEAINRVCGTGAAELVADLKPTISSVVEASHANTTALMALKKKPSAVYSMDNVVDRVCRRVTGVDETTRQRMTDFITAAAEEELSVTETVQRFKSRFSDISDYRARTIARTELNTAYTQSASLAFKDTPGLTHVSIIGCEAREPRSPQYRGESTCNIEDVPVEDSDKLEFHPNHTGCMVPSRFSDD